MCATTPQRFVLRRDIGVGDASYKSFIGQRCTRPEISQTRASSSVRRCALINIHPNSPFVLPKTLTQHTSNSQYSMPSATPCLKKLLFLPNQLAHRPPSKPEFCIKKSTSLNSNKNPDSLPTFLLTSSIVHLISQVS